MMEDVALEGKSVLEDVRHGVQHAREEMVEKACREALFRGFVMDLAVRMAIARGSGNPSVLTLDWCSQTQKIGVKWASLRSYEESTPNRNAS
jgi:hypothetical protein